MENQIKKIDNTPNYIAQELLQRIIQENYDELAGLDYVRKSPDAEETSREMPPLYFNRLDYRKQNAIKMLTYSRVHKGFSFYAKVFPEMKYRKHQKFGEYNTSPENRNLCIYLLETEGKLYLVNNEGYEYSRYTRELKGYISKEDHDQNWEDVAKENYINKY